MCGFGTNRQPRGVALIIAMLVMAVLLMAGTAFLTISSTENQIALNERVTTQAFLLAEAGLHKAIAQLNASSSYSGETNTSLGSGKFTVTVATAAGCTATSARDVVATGTVPVAGGQAQAVLRVTVDQVSYPFKWALFAAVPNGVVTGDRREEEVRIDNNGAVDTFDSNLATYESTSDSDKHKGGSVGANGDVTLDSGAVVWGNVSAGDAIHADSATVHGVKTPNSSAQSFPSITPTMSATTSLSVGDNGTTSLSAGTYSYNSVSVGKKGTLATTGAVTIYVSGNMSFDNNAALTVSGGPVTVYVMGKVELKNDVTWGSNPGTNLQVITKSDLPDSQTDNIPEFEAGNNFTFYGNLYGKSTDVKLGNNAQIYGSTIGRTVKVGNNASVHYDQALSDKQICTFGKYTILRGTWREVIP